MGDGGNSAPVWLRVRRELWLLLLLLVGVVGPLTRPLLRRGDGIAGTSCDGAFNGTNGGVLPGA